jgi:hypothetical protein
MFKAVKSLLLFAALVIMAATPAFAADGVVIKGSTTVLPIAQAAVDAYMTVRRILPILRGRSKRKRLNWLKRKV